MCIPRLNLLTGTQNDYYFDKRDRPRLELIRDYLNKKYEDTTPAQELVQYKEIVKETKLEIINEWRTQYRQDTLDKKQAAKAVEALNDIILSAIKTENIKSFSELKTFITTNFELEIIKEGWEGRYIDKDKDEREIDYFTLSVKKPNGTTTLKLKGGVYGEYRGVWGHNPEGATREEDIRTTTTRLNAISTNTNKSDKNGNGKIKFRNQRTMEEIKRQLDRANKNRLAKLEKRISKDRKEFIRKSRTGNSKIISGQGEIREQSLDNHNNFNISDNDNVTNIKLVSVDASVSKFDIDNRPKQSEIHSDKSTTTYSNKQQIILPNNEIGGTNDIKFDRTENERFKDNQQQRETGIIADCERIIQSAATDFGKLSEGVGKNLSVVAKGVERMKKEIDIFKTDISLIDFALSLGGEIKKDKSTKNSVVVDFHNTKLVITRNTNGHYIYFDMFNKNSNGTIIDFYKNVVDKNADFKKTMINLRKFYKSGYIPTEKLEIFNGVDEVFDYSRITKNIEQSDINTISIIRDISVDTIKEFKDIILKDNRQNNCFPNFEYYFDENDRFKFNLCGFEIKNPVTRFKLQQGSKGLWGKKIGNSQDIYVFESAYDAMAFRELHQKEGFYISVGGSISPKQIEYLKSVIKSAKSNNINLCLDNDTAGNTLSDNITEQLKTLKINIRRHKSQSKDWNQDLKDKKELIKKQEQDKKTTYTYKSGLRL
jgi:hypothetical protein